MFWVMGWELREAGVQLSKGKAVRQGAIEGNF